MKTLIQETEGLTGGTPRKTRIPFPYRTSKPQTNEFGGARNGTPDAGRLKARRATRITCGSICSSYRLCNQSTNFPAAYATRKLHGYRPTWFESTNLPPFLTSIRELDIALNDAWHNFITRAICRWQPAPRVSMRGIDCRLFGFLLVISSRKRSARDNWLRFHASTQNERIQLNLIKPKIYICILMYCARKFIKTASSITLSLLLHRID